ncbi:hypothetical protein HELRODRAFT_191951 [Helobdella robusta]|uniref:C-type lectin domain-containing protein n=1 Tax=Helobdella robusta TaxID=6412 RepID=T1FTG0_HELRO|nr:hypothetical protein HELRODRAFT_191951 [Helobdella robusta]ESO03759.1 hypothetical protein HELRODRAFT_191951 [Helobdella robusta]
MCCLKGVCEFEQPQFDYNHEGSVNNEYAPYNEDDEEEDGDDRKINMEEKWINGRKINIEDDDDDDDDKTFDHFKHKEMTVELKRDDDEDDDDDDDINSIPIKNNNINNINENKVTTLTSDPLSKSTVTPKARIEQKCHQGTVGLLYYEMTSSVMYRCDGRDWLVWKWGEGFNLHRAVNQHRHDDDDDGDGKDDNDGKKYRYDDDDEDGDEEAGDDDDDVRSRKRNNNHREDRKRIEVDSDDDDDDDDEDDDEGVGKEDEDDEEDDYSDDEDDEDDDYYSYHCSRNEILYKEHCYTLLKHESTWRQAEVACRRTGSHLTVPTSWPHLNWLTDVIAGGSRFWIGLRGKRKYWYEKSGKLASFINWKEGHPQHSNKEKCVLVTKRRNWIDKDCGSFKARASSSTTIISKAGKGSININVHDYNNPSLLTLPPVTSKWPVFSPLFLKVFSAFLYGSSSFLITVVNKITLTSYKFPSYQFLGLAQMMSTVVFLGLARLFNIITFPSLDRNLPQKIWPLPLVYFLNLVTGLGGTQNISLPMFTVLRRFSILFTMIAEYWILKTKATPKVQLCVFLMIFGAIVAAIDDLSFQLHGYLLVLTNNIFTAANGVYTKQKLEAKELGELGLIFYNSLFMLPLSFALTYFTGDIDKAISYTGWIDYSFCISFSSSCIMGFVLMYSIISCTNHNSALTTTIIGVLKNLFITYLGMVIGGDYKFSIINFIGVNISVSGSLFYTYITFISSNQKKLMAEVGGQQK